MKLSVIVPSLTGAVPKTLRKQVSGNPEVEIVTVVGMRPVGKARNEGLRRAAGEYVAWVDGDDEVADDWLAEILAALACNPDALIFDAKNEGWPCMGDLVYGKPNADDAVRDVYENECLQGHLWRTVTRRALWDGLAFDETLCAMEDFLILPQVLLRAKNVRYLPKTLYRYLYHEGSALTKANLRRHGDDIRMAIRRWQETPDGFAAASLRGSMRLVYDSLLALNVDPRYRTSTEVRMAGACGRKFLRQYVGRVRVGWRVRLRYACAGYDFWACQRLVHWYHFER